jgi:hypothetical protein
MDATNISDPAGLAARAPALATLAAQNPSVASALGRGDRKALHDALAEIVRRRPGTTDAGHAAQLLKRRRLFLAPLQRAPALFRVNGCGVGLYGESDKDPEDGTYVATYCLSFLFIPVLPLAQYVVRNAGGRSYNFFGKVPLSGAARLWRRVVGGAAAAMALLVLNAGLVAKRTAKLQVVNGLEIPVVVTIDGQRLDVPAGGHVAARHKAGKATLAARTAAGAPLESLSVDLPGLTDVVTYNVLGAAPLYAEGVVYRARASNEENPTVFYGGQSFVTRDHVSYVFTEPPQSIDMHGASETRWRFDVAKGGLSTTVEMLLHTHKDAEAAALARKVALAAPESRAAIHEAERFVGKEGVEALVAFAKRLADAHPASVEAQRYYQDGLRMVGRLDEARRIYDERLQATPGSPAAEYLSARLRPLKEALPRLQAILKAHPDDHFAMGAVAYDLFVTRRFAEALPLFERMHALDPQADFSYHARTLVALGRRPEAVMRVRNAPQPARFTEALRRGVLCARLARLAGAASPATPDQCYALTEAKEATSKALWLSLSGAPLPDEVLAKIDPPAFRATLELAPAVRRDLPRALSLLTSTSVAGLASIDQEGALLLATELARQGKRGAESEAAFTALGEAALPAAAIRRYLADGKEDAELELLDLDVQAALHFGRARALEAAGKPQPALLQRAVSEDVLGSGAAAAAAAWPRPR